MKNKLRSLIHLSAILISTKLDFGYIGNEWRRMKGIQLVLRNLLKLMHDPQISAQLRHAILNQIKLISRISVLNNGHLLNDFSEEELSEVAINLHDILNKYKCMILAEV